MADSYWKSQPNANVPSRSFITGMPTMFSVPHYSNALNALRQEKGIGAEFNHNLVAVDPSTRSATFEVLAGDKKGEKVQREYGILHVTPPMGPLDWIKKSPLADGAGWVDVDQGSLQHKKFENVFSLGDSSSLPTSKVSTRFWLIAREPHLTDALGVPPADRVDCRGNHCPSTRLDQQPRLAPLYRENRRREIRWLHLVPALHGQGGAHACRVQVRVGAQGDVRMGNGSEQAKPVS